MWKLTALSFVFSQSVQQDEMLQLAMLRWIVDYWSNEATSPPSEASATDQSRRPSQTSAPPTDRPAAPQQRQEVRWSELLPMLTMTTEQMSTEVQSLQARHESYSSTVLASGATSSGPSTALSSTAPRTSTSSSVNVDSVQGLYAMLKSMNLDERAKPAVMEYKRLVQSLPPSRSVVILFAVARRCPALLTILSLIFLGLSGGMSTVLILLPFTVFELLRVKEWKDSCERTVPIDEQKDEAPLLEQVDPMVMLLSGDRLSLRRPPVLLSVWLNVCSSVSALETGLTAARCVQTTVVAVDFAGNLMSLAQFGVEVSQRGWLHGLGVVLKEVVMLHAGADSTHANDTKYSNAAIKTVQNTRTMSRNLSVLMKEEGHVVNHLFGVLSGVVGKGWLWGRDEGKQVRRSTVEIEQLDDFETEDTDEMPTRPRRVGGSSDHPSSPGPSDRQLRVFEGTLTDHLDAEVDLPAPSERGVEVESNVLDDVPELMNLVAECAERGLIDEVRYRVLRLQTLLFHAHWSPLLLLMPED